MDIHPLHLPIHNWKDFLLHLLTITVGLFIALTLEASIESIHHRHLVRDAHRNLRQEIQANHTQYAANTARESGAVPYMDADSISMYSSIYAQQQDINTTALSLLNEETKAAAALQVAGTPAGLTAAETESLLIKSAELDQSFAKLQVATMKALDHFYLEALGTH